jgi:hypothetical protein
MSKSALCYAVPGRLDFKDSSFGSYSFRDHSPNVQGCSLLPLLHLSHTLSHTLNYIQWRYNISPHSCAPNLGFETSATLVLVGNDLVVKGDHTASRIIALSRFSPLPRPSSPMFQTRTGLFRSLSTLRPPASHLLPHSGYRSV